jgi:hypothetical protein
MQDGKEDLKPGTRVRLTKLGIERSPKLKSHTGIIVGVSHGARSFRVLIDGRKMPLALHESYIEADRGA